MHLIDMLCNDLPLSSGARFLHRRKTSRGECVTALELVLRQEPLLGQALQRITVLIHRGPVKTEHLAGFDQVFSKHKQR